MIYTVFETLYPGSMNSSKKAPLRPLNKPKEIRWNGKKYIAKQYLDLGKVRYFIVKVLSGKRERYMAFDLRHGSYVEMRCVMGIEPESNDLIHTLRRLSRQNSALPNLINVHPYEKGKKYLATTWIDGKDLQYHFDSWRKRPRSYFGVGKACYLMRRLGHSLYFFHKSNLIHGDLSPKNLIWEQYPNECLTMIDFGNAWPIEHTIRRSLGDGINSRYAAPELLLQEVDVDERCDHFSFGVIWYELLCFETPYSGYAGRLALPEFLKNRVEIESYYKPPSKNSMYSDAISQEAWQLVDTIIGRCVKLSRDDRYPNSAALRKDIKALDRILELSGALKPENEALLEELMSPKKDMNLPKKAPPSKQQSSSKKISLIRRVKVFSKRIIQAFFDWLERLL